MGLPTGGERSALYDQQLIEAAYPAGENRTPLSALTADSPPADFLLFAMLSQPQVEAAYYDWAAAVGRITIERSLPDPQLTFQSDIAEMVMSLMPGLMMELPGPGKLKEMANVATAESEVKYFAFEASVLQAAFAFKKAYYELQFVDAKTRVIRETLRLATEIENIARRQNEVGRSTLQDVLRAQIEQERLAAEIANLEDSRHPVLAQFKAALGLRPDDASPPLPRRFETTPQNFTSEKLLVAALARNPRLKSMAAEVQRADASLRLAFKARVPDFQIGLEADVKASPAIFTPQAGVTLPIWRDKIAAQIAAAQSDVRAAEARLSAEQIALAVEFAEKSFMFREASRNFELFNGRLLSLAKQSFEVAQSGYAGGKVDFLNLIDAERTLLDFQVSGIEARLQRELALAELSLVILGRLPANAPVLAVIKEPQS